MSRTVAGPDVRCSLDGARELRCGRERGERRGDMLGLLDGVKRGSRCPGNAALHIQGERVVLARMKGRLVIQGRMMTVLWLGRCGRAPCKLKLVPQSKSGGTIGNMPK